MSLQRRLTPVKKALVFGQALKIALQLKYEIINATQKENPTYKKVHI